MGRERGDDLGRYPLRGYAGRDDRKSRMGSNRKRQGTAPAGEQNYPAAPRVSHCIFSILGSDVCPAGEWRVESDDGPLRVSDWLHVAARPGKTGSKRNVRLRMILVQ